MRLPDNRNAEFRKSKSSYGWYRWHFVLPESFSNRELHINLGHIADLDWTYLNGQLVGSTTDASVGWRTKRYYVARPELLRAGDNVLAVKVARLRSIAGMHDSPLIGLPLASADTTWQASVGAPADGVTEAVPDATHASFTVAPGTEVLVELPGEQISYRLAFTLPADLDGAAVAFRDAGARYQAVLNGHAFSSGGCSTPLEIPAEVTGTRLLLPNGYGTGDEKNLLLIMVDHRAGPQRAPELPILWLNLPGAPVSDAYHPGMDPQSERRVIRALIEADQRGAASERLAALQAGAGADPRMLGIVAPEAMALSGADSDDEAVLGWFSRLVVGSPTTAFDSRVVESVLKVQGKRGAIDPRAFYLGEDRDTRGDWPGCYGRGAHILCAMMEYEIAGGPDWPLDVRFRTADPSQTAKVYIGKSNSDSPTALRDPYRRTRTIAWRDDYGEHDSFALAGPDLIADVALPAGQWLVSFYIMDPDWSSTEHPRDLSIVLTELTEATPLAVARATDLAEGVYHRFLVTGPLALSTRICKHRSPDANLSGIFLDRVERLRPVPETLARTSALPATDRIARQYAATTEAVLTALPDWPAYVKALHDLRARIDQFRATRSAACDPAAEWMRWQVATHLGETAEARDAIACIVASLHVGREPQEEQECLESLLGLRAAGGFGADGGPLLTAAILQRLAQVATGEARLQALEQLARLRVDLVDDAGAAEAYRQIVETAPAGEYISRAHFGLGMFLYQQNQGDQALAEFRLAVDAAPDSVDGELAKLFVDRLEQAGGEAAHAGGR